MTDQAFTTIEHDCPKCGRHERRHYRDVDFVEYGHDKFMFKLGVLVCGNCENGSDASQDDYGVQGRSNESEATNG